MPAGPWSRRNPPPGRDDLVPGRQDRDMGRPLIHKVNPSGNISFAGPSYRVGNGHKRKNVEVRLVGDTVPSLIAGKIICTHAAKHDRAEEQGAFATPKGRPGKLKASHGDRVTFVGAPSLQETTLVSILRCQQKRGRLEIGARR
jgi:hypothetical protein